MKCVLKAPVAVPFPFTIVAFILTVGVSISSIIIKREEIDY